MGQPPQPEEKLYVAWISEDAQKAGTPLTEGGGEPVSTTYTQLVLKTNNTLKAKATARSTRGALCGKTARRDLRGGRPATGGSP